MSARWGLIARAENRGIGIQTLEMYRHLAPDRVLVVDVQNPDGFDLHLDRYPDATVLRLTKSLWLPETATREWLDGLDVVVSVETLYDWRLAEWAREQRVSTVVQVNPEFYQHARIDLPEPSVWWNPTTWRTDSLPADARHVPVPVALDRWVGAEPCEREGPLRALHVVGRPALGDRNGTELVAKAMRRVTGVALTVTAQRPTAHSWIHAATVPEVDDYWRLYDDQDVLVLPRRYGGLCLPAQEAMAAGLAVVMPGCSPNTDWPIEPVGWQNRGTIDVPCGPIPLCETDARDLAGVLARLASDNEALDVAKKRSRQWAETHSWDAMEALYLDEIERAADRT